MLHLIGKNLATQGWIPYAPTAATTIFRSTGNFSILMSFIKPRRNKIPNNEVIDISDVTT
jgi:hypothetical protein